MDRRDIRVDLQDGQIAVVDHGGTGPDVLLIHSVCHSSAVWEDVAAALQGDARVVAIDLPGHGQSSAEATGSGQVTEAVLAVIQTLGLRRPVLVGHDVSGGFAAAVADTHPEAIGALVLIDSPTVDPQETVRETARMVSSDDVLDLLTARFALGRTGPDAASMESFIDEFAPRASADTLGATPDESTMRALMRRGIVTEPDGSWTHRPHPDTMRVLTLDTDDPTVHPGRELLATMQVPFSVVVLEEGRHGTGGDAMADLANSRPSARVVTLGGDAHVLYRNPSAVAEAILEASRMVDGTPQPA